MLRNNQAVVSTFSLGFTSSFGFYEVITLLFFWV